MVQAGRELVAGAGVEEAAGDSLATLVGFCTLGAGEGLGRGPIIL